ncbi:MAG TPA: RDD family protein [Steroidobacteraceae bacterium]
MNTRVRRSITPLTLVVFSALAGPVWAQSAPAARQAEFEYHLHHGRVSHGEHDTSVVSVGHDSHLAAGERAHAVVAVLGSAISEGDAGDVVAIFGDARVTGSLDHSAVSVFGTTYVDGRIGGDAVAVFGSVVLGPNADIGGNAVAIGGSLQRDPAAIVHGGTQTVFTGLSGFGWLRPWIKHCLLFGRPLALTAGVGWAWGVALGFLCLYVLLALVFRGGVERCVLTFESRPGLSIVAALLTVLLSPLLLTVLCVTVIGIAAIPFVVAGLFCAGLFGKAVMLAWIGRLCLGRRGGPSHPALTVLIGGAIVVALYLVPVLGFVIYKLLGLLGLGTVVLTLLQSMRAPRAAQDEARASPPAAPPPTEPAAAVAGTHAEPVGPSPAAALPRAGFWVRIAALLLDALLIGIIVNLLHHLFNLELLVLAAYGAVMWKLRGSTIGGIVFDLQVVRLDGRDIDWATAIVRALGCLLSLAVAGLGFIWIAFDDGKQAWHDKIAGTAVIRVAKGISLV